MLAWSCCLEGLTMAVLHVMREKGVYSKADVKRARSACTVTILARPVSQRSPPTGVMESWDRAFNRTFWGHLFKPQPHPAAGPEFHLDKQSRFCLKSCLREESGEVFGMKAVKEFPPWRTAYFPVKTPDSLPFSSARVYFKHLDQSENMHPGWPPFPVSFGYPCQLAREYFKGSWRTNKLKSDYYFFWQ